MRLFDRLRRRSDRQLRAGALSDAELRSATVRHGSESEKPANFCAEGDRWLAQGAAERALEAYQAAIDAAAGQAGGHIGQARAYLALDRIEDACDSLEIALAIEPDCLAALQLLAHMRREEGSAEEAVALLERAVLLAPNRSELHCELALTLNRAGRVEDAVEAYLQAIERDPRDPAAHINLGLLYIQQLGDPVEAERHLRQALQIEPGHVAAIANLGLALHDQHRCDEALALYRDGLRQHPDHVELRWNEALTHLSLGEFEQGWPGYEMRFLRSGGRRLDRFPLPDWDGAALPDSALLVLAEQGIGDEIMFASCLSDVRARVGGNVVLECAPRLEALFARSFPGVAVRGKERGSSPDWLRQYPDLRAKAAIGSLPRFLRRSRASFPAHNGYLRADGVRVEQFRQRMRALGSGLSVGISWRGGTRGTRGALRSVALDALQPLLAVPNVRFYSLQHRIRPDEREQARAAGMMVWDGSTDDPDQTAALIAALDLTITVANTNAHLTGALGRPGWVLLNESPEWRWMQTGGRSPWYPSLALHRCDGSRRWTQLIGSVAQNLAALTDGKRVISA